jgi:hypothetical protein
LNKLQKVKNKLKNKIDIILDLKQVLLKELFSPEFMPRTGIFLDGISIFANKPFAETLGFRSYSLFIYNLKNLTHTEKIKFNYAMSGRNSRGLIEELNGQRILSGAIKIPSRNSMEFESILKKYSLDYKMTNILEEA